MKPRIILCPGYIVSKNDGDQHYIGPAQLAALYDVPLHLSVLEDKCYGENKPPTRHDLVLTPRYDGNYCLTDEERATVMKLIKKAKQ